MYPITEELLHFGLTRQEANLYLALLEQGEMTGYEAAKLTGISRSNTYTALAGLVDKGAAFIMEENVTRYTAVPFGEFSHNVIRHLQKKQEEILPRLPEKKKDMQGYITIRGTEQIMDKLVNLICEAEQRLYISVPGDILRQIQTHLEKQVRSGKRVVILTDFPYEMEGAETYITGKSDCQIRLIVDSFKVLTGKVAAGEHSTCLYSLNGNLVDVFKDMLQNEIRLIELERDRRLF